MEIPPPSTEAPASSRPQQKTKEMIIDPSRYLDKKIRVKFNGGREGMVEFRVLDDDDSGWYTEGI